VQRDTEGGRALALVVERNSNAGRTHKTQFLPNGFEGS